ncbi:hypothetical protein [Dictyobacter arantiisoli]|uniref:DUF3159 domain-containing protein n=1 Tax=Dictyobacter arantiisoli TaxID=2014874 RepID=A0A5A5T545_9CHLR|nr:hypothetical protein [Dictyobacter arantiisoli]GCF06460.1 hypothetical protein KDI_00240 [Dictyobacter arantiisoli]
MDKQRHAPRLDFTNVVPSNILQTIVIDLAFPYMLYPILTARMPLLGALGIVALFPIAHIIWNLYQRRMLDLIGIGALYFLLWALINDLVPASSLLQLELQHYTLPIALVGLLILLTHVVGKPLLFYIDRYCHAHSTAQNTAYNDYWQENATYRRMLYRLNIVWGVGQIIFAALLLALFRVISSDIYFTVALVASCLFYVIMAMWSVHYEDTYTQSTETTSNDDQKPYK